MFLGHDASIDLKQKPGLCFFDVVFVFFFECLVCLIFVSSIPCIIAERTSAVETKHKYQVVVSTKKGSLA